MSIHLHYECMCVCVEMTFHTFLTSALAGSEDEVTLVTNSTHKQVTPVTNSTHKQVTTVTNSTHK